MIDIRDHGGNYGGGYSKGSKLNFSKISQVGEIVESVPAVISKSDYNSKAKRLCVTNNVSPVWIQIYSPESLTEDYKVNLTHATNDMQAMSVNNQGDLFYNQNSNYYTRKFTKATGNLAVWGNTTIGRIRNFPGSIDFSDDGLKMYVMSTAYHAQEINTVDGTVLRKLTVTNSTYTNCMRLDEENSCIYVCGDSSHIAKAPLSTFTISAQLPLEEAAHHIQSSKNFLFVLGPTTLTIIDKKTFVKLTSVKTASLDYIFSAVDYENDLLYVMNTVLSGGSFMAYNSFGQVVANVYKMSPGDSRILGYDGDKTYHLLNTGSIERRKYYSKII